MVLFEKYKQSVCVYIRSSTSEFGPFFQSIDADAY